MGTTGVFREFHGWGGGGQESRGEKMERSEDRMGFRRWEGWAVDGGCDGFVGHVSPGCRGGMGGPGLVVPRGVEGVKCAAAVC